ncbi:MAG: NTP transferase domain-containing protein, partial [Actinomycetota bacterium]|nr:NTP transferase domain-containing protein [Actinomycetota bacterium]
AHEVEVDAHVVHCDEWARGPGASLRCGLAALPADVPGAIVVLADGPDLNPVAIDRLLALTPAAEVLAASYEGERGHPLFLPRAAFGGVPDDGMRAVPARLVPCDDLGSPGDVDFPEDMPAMLARRQDGDV